MNLVADMAASVCHPSIWEAELGEPLRLLGQPGLYSKFQASQTYVARPCLRKERIEITHG